METTDLMFNRSAILHALLTTYKGRELELLHEFAQVFSQLASNINDFRNEFHDQPVLLDKQERNLVKELRRVNDDFFLALQAGLVGVIDSPNRRSFGFYGAKYFVNGSEPLSRSWFNPFFGSDEEDVRWILLSLADGRVP